MYVQVCINVYIYVYVCACVESSALLRGNGQKTCADCVRQLRTTAVFIFILTFASSSAFLLLLFVSRFGFDRSRIDDTISCVCEQEGVYVEHVTSEKVTSEAEVLALLARGSCARSKGETQVGRWLVGVCHTSRRVSRLAAKNQIPILRSPDRPRVDAEHGPSIHGGPQLIVVVNP